MTRRTRIALCLAWWAVGLGGVIAADLTYGWATPPIDHPWHAVAYGVFVAWIIACRRLWP